MKKNLFVSVAFTVSFLYSHSQLHIGQLNKDRVPAPTHHYKDEYTFDTIVNPALWSKVGKGMHVSFASTDDSWFRSEVPALQKETTTLQATSWKGERVNVLLLVWSPDTLRQIRVSLPDLKAPGGAIDAKNIQANLVKYVISNYPYGARDATCGESPYKNLYLMPDRFERLQEDADRFDLPGRTVRPVWISIDVPANTPQGNYAGTIQVTEANQSTGLTLTIKVQNQILPPPSQWKHRLDLWQNPWTVAWKNNLVPWSDAHKMLLKQHLQLYADAGGSFITTYGVHSPWADNSYMIEGGMIDWIKTKDNKWKFDYNIFDQYVELAMSVGIKDAITLYTPVPWGFRFRYTDEKTGNYVYESWPPDSKQFNDVWQVFLTDLAKHLDQKGWFNITYLGINENEMSQTKAAIQVIKRHPRKWKITYAGDWHPELDSLLDDYCYVYGKESDTSVIEARRRRGKTTTYYVCCNPPVPNNFVYSPPIEGRWISWYSVAHGYDGFLRWAYDAWPTDEMRDARHPFWPAGDSYLVYPGGNSCVRFEKLREGIVDFEKIRILREKGKKSADKKVQSLLVQLDEHLKVFLAEKDFNTEVIKGEVNQGLAMVDQLSEMIK